MNNIIMSALVDCVTAKTELVFWQEELDILQARPHEHHAAVIAKVQCQIEQSLYAYDDARDNLYSVLKYNNLDFDTILLKELL